jgi:hypothetical protein
MTTATRSAHDEAFGAALYRLLAAHGGNLVSPPTRQHRGTLRVALCGAAARPAFPVRAHRHGGLPLFPGRGGTG